MRAHLQRVASGLDAATVLRAETALEEMLSNSIVHGGANALPEPVVWIGADARLEGLLVRYEDPFAPFDPMAKLQEALHRTTHPLEQRPVGGVGLLMVYRLADAFRYVRERERNRTDMLFATRPPARRPFPDPAG